MSTITAVQNNSSSITICGVPEVAGSTPNHRTIGWNFRQVVAVTKQY